jgi:hypothetical protein
MRRRLTLPILILLTSLPLSGAVQLQLPNTPDSLKMAVIGDSGTGTSSQYDIGKRMAESRATFPLELVLMLGDNIYGSEGPSAFRKKFEMPYKPLLDAGVKFYAVLGNHDEREQANYKLFNMNGQRYYSFKAPKQSVRFFGLESDYMDRKQIDWLDGELSRSTDDWKIVFMHHPIYSSGGRHGADLALREVLEPLFLKHGVSLVLAGHEHFYERLKPQNGIHYITEGGSAKLRRGNIRDNSELTARGFDTDYSFMLMEIEGDVLHLQTISRRGDTVDRASLPRRKMPDTTTSPISLLPRGLASPPGRLPPSRSR